jgi:hypothetical protein
MQKISANLFAEIIAVVVPAISKLITHKETEVKKEDLAYTKGYFPWLLCRRICQGLTIGVSLPGPSMQRLKDSPTAICSFGN